MSQSHETGRWTPEMWEGRIYAAIEAAQEDGIADCYSGVPGPIIQEQLPRCTQTVQKNLNRLAAAGQLKRYKRRHPDSNCLCYAYAPATGEEVVTGSDADPDPPWNYLDHSRAEWGEEHAVIPEVLPYSYLDYDRLEHLATIREFLSGRPQWCENVPRGTIRTRIGESGSNINEHIEIVCLQLGWWRSIADNSDRKAAFYNPNYGHPHRDENLITDTDDRRELLKMALGLGLGVSTVAPAFGLAAATVRTDYPRKLIGEDWHAIKDEGSRRMDQTIRTIIHWGHTLEEVAAAFGITTRGVSKIVRRTKEDGYTPPDDPTYDAPINAHPGEEVGGR